MVSGRGIFSFVISKSLSEAKSFRATDRHRRHGDRTKATLIYRRTENLRAVQLLLGTADILPTNTWLKPAPPRPR
jgi:hypothetical protein